MCAIPMATPYKYCNRGTVCVPTQAWTPNLLSTTDQPIYSKNLGKFHISSPASNQARDKFDSPSRQIARYVRARKSQQLAGEKERMRGARARAHSRRESRADDDDVGPARHALGYILAKAEELAAEASVSVRRFSARGCADNTGFAGWNVDFSPADLI